MAPLEQLASPHDALVMLVSKLPRPALLRILCAAAGIELLDVGEVRERHPAFEIPNLNRRARKGLIDLLITVYDSDGAVVMHWILEVQLSWDSEKEWNWALYAVAVAAESKKPTRVAAFVPNPALRARIRTKLIPKISPTPALVERDHIELIDDTQEALRRPHETILGAVYHAGSDAPVERRMAAMRAAFIAVETLDPWESRSYTVLMLTTTPGELLDRILEEFRASGEGVELDERDPRRWTRFEDYEISESEIGSYTYERAIRKGRREVLQRALVDVLELRGFTVSAEHRARVQSCEDLEALERWYAKARTLPTTAPLDQLFE